MKYHTALGARLAGPFFAFLRSRRARALCSALLLGAPVLAQALELSLESRRHSDPLPLSQIGDDDDIARLTPRSGRNVIYLRDELRVSAPWAGGHLSALVRQSATLVANREALALAADTETHGAPTLSGSFPVQARYTGFVGGGLAWSRASSPMRSQGSGWHWEAGVQALMLHRLQWREIHGQLDIDAAAKRYGLDFSYGRADPGLDYAYQPDTVPDQGYALLLQGALRWCGASLCLHAGVEDLGRLFWPRLVREEGRGSTAPGTDADGNIVYPSLLSGRYRQGTWQQSAPATLQWRAQWQLAPAWRAELHADRLQGFGLLPSAHLRWQPAGIEWSASWRMHERQLGLQARGTNWQLGFAADRLGGKARSRALQAALVWPWH